MALGTVHLEIDMKCPFLSLIIANLMLLAKLNTVLTFNTIFFSLVLMKKGRIKN